MSFFMHLSCRRFVDHAFLPACCHLCCGSGPRCGCPVGTLSAEVFGLYAPHIRHAQTVLSTDPVDVDVVALTQQASTSQFTVLVVQSPFCGMQRS